MSVEIILEPIEELLNSLESPDEEVRRLAVSALSGFPFQSGQASCCSLHLAMRAGGYEKRPLTSSSQSLQEKSCQESLSPC